MKYLLFEGSSNVGKTSAIIRMANKLVSRYGYNCIGTIPTSGCNCDFKAVLERTLKNGDTRRILVNSASDTPKIIDAFKDYASCNGPYNMIISSCREEDFLYNYFCKTFSISNEDIVLEIPMAKINHKNESLKQKGMKWYKDKIDHLADVLFGCLK